MAGGVARLLLGATTKDVACSGLSFLGLCTDNEKLDKNFDIVMSTQLQFHSVLHRVQTRNDANSALLGNEVKETQKSNKKTAEVAGNQLILRGKYHFRLISYHLT